MRPLVPQDFYSPSCKLRLSHLNSVIIPAATGRLLGHELAFQTASFDPVDRNDKLGRRAIVVVNFGRRFLSFRNFVLANPFMSVPSVSVSSCAWCRSVCPVRREPNDCRVAMRISLSLTSSSIRIRSLFALLETSSNRSLVPRLPSPCLEN